MDEILDALLDAFGKRADPYRFATELIKRKAAERGLVLSKRHLQKVEAALRGEATGEFVVHMPGKGPSREFKIEFEEGDFREIEGRVQRVVDQLPEVIGYLIDVTTNYMIRTLKRTWAKEARRQQREGRRFARGLRKRWSHPLQLLAMILTIAREKGKEVNDALRGEPDPMALHTVEALTRLHARSCQVAGEVLALLCEGFADGALARWRTQHEISVVARVVRQNGEACAERYLAHAAVESYRAAVRYQRHCSALGYDQLSDAEMRRLSESKKAAVERYGGGFDEDYGWAAPYVNGKRPTFAGLEDLIGASHLRPYYKMASGNVHPSAKGIQFALGLKGDEGILLAGPSHIGLADPGQLSAIALAQGTITLLSLETTLDNAVASNVLLQMAKEAAEAFCSVDPWPDGPPEPQAGC